ncbi:MerR family transcriptional regulator [Actinomadura barringtoniae]|uniref:MerR family transcriptional regulator n=1 Tax=Actinomadura barringtoniae TaxID=1427535 RepID=UPI001FB60BF1|nr:MerR family transcriptional regulator [Actinomadura barringtoniae]
MDGTWTITELADRATAALAAGDAVRVNGRVRDLPNERLIRWYTTIGLVDPPLGRRGRTALYGPRHLLQLVAVKRRQAAGRTIAEIQTELTGATDSTLTEIARIPAHSPDDTDTPEAAATDTTTPARERFWLTRATAADAASDNAAPGSAAPGSTTPANSAPGSATPANSAPGNAAPGSAAAGSAASDGTGSHDVVWDRPVSARPATAGERREPLSVVQGVRLAAGLTLMLDVPALTGDDLAAIEIAARPLVDELARRGLIGSIDSPGRSS